MTETPEPEEGESPLATAYARALAHEAEGRAAEAIAAYREALALDPEDHTGSSVRIAALGGGPAPEGAPPAYVATLFDQHADAFERILVEDLDYGIPWEIREMLDALGAGPFARMLDLGCGTGLVAEAMEGQFAEAVGIDLSAGMLEIAHEKEAYAELFEGDALVYLSEAGAARWDLIAAADMLPYLGPVEPLFAAAATGLVPGGRLVLSSEAPDPGTLAARGWHVGPDHRFHHDPAYLVAALAEAGLTVERMEPTTIRLQNGAPAPGHLSVALRPAG